MYPTSGGYYTVEQGGTPRQPIPATLPPQAYPAYQYSGPAVPTPTIHPSQNQGMQVPPAGQMSRPYQHGVPVTHQCQTPWSGYGSQYRNSIAHNQAQPHHHPYDVGTSGPHHTRSIQASQKHKSVESRSTSPSSNTSEDSSFGRSEASLVSSRGDDASSRRPPRATDRSSIYSSSSSMSRSSRSYSGDSRSSSSSSFSDDDTRCQSRPNYGNGMKAYSKGEPGTGTGRSQAVETNRLGRARDASWGGAEDASPGLTIQPPVRFCHYGALPSNYYANRSNEYDNVYIRPRASPSKRTRRDDTFAEIADDSRELSSSDDSRDEETREVLKETQSQLRATRRAILSIKTELLCSRLYRDRSRKTQRIIQSVWAATLKDKDNDAAGSPDNI